VIFLLSTLVPFSAILSFIVWRVIDTMVYKLITAVKKEGIEQLDDFKKLRKEYRVKYYSVVITIILILQIPSTIEVFLRWYYWV
jgi:hypothetical protein